MVALLLAGVVIFDYVTGNEPGFTASASIELGK
jgi:hypothetical protein